MLKKLSLQSVSKIIGWMSIAALFGLIVLLTQAEIRDSDLWRHFAMGKFMVKHHFVPKVDVLSCSILGKPMINHEWLFQIFVYLMRHWFGYAGVINMQVVVVSLTFLLLLFLAYPHKRQLITLFSLLIVLFIYKNRFTIRPDIYSIFFLTVYFFILGKCLDKKWSLPFLSVVQIIWANMHGFFILGPLWVTILVVSEWIKRKQKLPFEWNNSDCLTDLEFRRLKQIWVLTALACFLNPQFSAGVWFPFRCILETSGDAKIFYASIQELRKPLTLQSLMHQNALSFYKVLFLVSGTSFILNYRKINIGLLFLWIIAALFSFVAIRNLAYFSIVGFMVFMSNIKHVRAENILPFRFTDEKIKIGCIILIKLFLILWIKAYFDKSLTNKYYNFDNYTWKSRFGGVSLKYPHKAANFLINNNIKGNFFNDFNSGNFLTDRIFPNIRLYIDARTEVYGGEFYKKFQQLVSFQNTNLFEEEVQKFNIQGVFLHSNTHKNLSRMLKYLYAQPEWVLVYFDEDAVIFLKDIPEYQDLIDRYSINLNQYKTRSIDLGAYGINRVKPAPNLRRAVSLKSFGFTDQALGEIEEALKVFPSYSAAHTLKAQICEDRNLNDCSKKHFRLGAMFNQNNITARQGLIRAHLALGELDIAEEQCNLLIKDMPNNSQGYLSLAHTLALKENYAKSFYIVTKAFKIRPPATKDLIKIGDVYRKARKFDLAELVYRLGLKTQNKSLAQSRLSNLGAKIKGELTGATAPSTGSESFIPSPIDHDEFFENEIKQTEASSE